MSGGRVDIAQQELHFSEQHQSHMFFILASGPHENLPYKLKKGILQDMYETKMLSPWRGLLQTNERTCLLKFQPARLPKKKVSRLKNTNNHALKYWPFYEGEGLTSGFIKKKKKTTCD